jgi:flagellar basal-body rod modification protein FlgD
MSEINTNLAVNQDIFDQYKLPEKNKKDEDPNALAQDDFLTLMTTQLKHQDPMKPMENGEFLGQMAQFSTVSGLGELKDSFDQMAASFGSSQALAAAGLIGKEVLTTSNEVTLHAEGEGISGAIELPQSTHKALINIYDGSGSLVNTIDLGAQSSGQLKFSWNGETSDGSPAPTGRYEFRAEYATDKNETQAATTLINAKIDSVGFKEGKVILNTADGQAHDFASVSQIG